MSGWPDYVDYGFDRIGYHNAPFFELAIERFASRWGGLEIECFVRALQEGTGEDVLVSMLAVGSTNTLWGAQLLLPFLTSPQPMEQWPSAICLGNMREAQALPVLKRILTQFLPPDVQYTAQGSIERFYDSWRPHVARLVNELETDSSKSVES